MLEFQTSNTDTGDPVSSYGWLLPDVPEGRSLRTHATLQYLAIEARVSLRTVPWRI